VYEGRFVEFDVRRAGDEAFDMQIRECDEIIFVIFVDVEQRVADLLENVNGTLNIDCR
jgi:hypothetical protein